jgi:hypothetical protein
VTNRNIFKELAEARAEYDVNGDTEELDRAAATIKRFGPRFEVGYFYAELDGRFDPFAWFASETDANVFLDEISEAEPDITFVKREIYA